MLLAKKRPVAISTARNYEKEVEALVARRNAIDNLIDALEAYDKGRVARAMAILPQRRTA